MGRILRRHGPGRQAREPAHASRALTPPERPLYNLCPFSFGAWRSLASALAWGARGRRFKSCRPDQSECRARRATNRGARVGRSALIAVVPRFANRSAVETEAEPLAILVEAVLVRPLPDRLSDRDAVGSPVSREHFLVGQEEVPIPEGSL